jgi:cytochrome c-type biogenesis protein CcsB
MTNSALDVRLFWFAFLAYLGAFLAFALYAATRRKRRIGIAANVLFATGFVLHTTGLVLRWVASGHAPMSNMFEYASLLSWMAVGSYLLVEFQYRRTIVGAFVAPVVVALMTCASLLPKELSQRLVPALQSYWLTIHVSLAALGEGAFAVAFAVSVMYLVRDARERRAGHRTPVALAHTVAVARPRGLAPHGTGQVAVLEAEDFDVDSLLSEVSGSHARAVERSDVLPSLRALDEINYRATTLGYPLYTIGALFAGAIWAYNAWGSFWSWDPKEVGAFVIWLFYTAYLHARMQRAWSGRRAAWLSVAGFAMVILSFLGNLWLGGNHAYK